jgi:O-antigen/teichoic acid export membrane protein
VSRTGRSIAATSGARIYSALAALATTTITARYLGPSGRGQYVAAVAWVTAFSTIGYLSLSQVVVFLATGKRREEWLPRVAGTLAAIVAAATAAGWLAAFGLYAWRGGTLFRNLPPLLLIVCFSSLPLLMWIENGSGVLMAMERVDVMNVALVAAATAAPLLTLGTVAILHRGVTGALAALLISQAIAAGISFRHIAGAVPELRFDRGAARELLGGGAKLHLNAIGTYLFTQANVLILNAYRPPRETAYYQLAMQLVGAIQIVPMAASTVTYSIIARDGPNAAWPEHRNVLAAVLGIVVLLGAMAWTVAPWAVPFIFGTAFAPSVPLFRILLLASIGMTMSAVMAPQWITRGLFIEAAMLTLIVGAATVTANLLVVPRWGTTGAAWVTVGTYTFSIAGNGAMALWVQSRWRRGLRKHE